MRALASIVFVLCAAVSLPAHQRDSGKGADQYAGTWTGSWDAQGTGGGFELTLEAPKEGPMTGRVSVTGEPTYKATLKRLSFDGAKLTAGYDFPPDESAEVILTATFAGATAEGEWLLREKASGTEVASGTWKVARK